MTSKRLTDMAYKILVTSQKGGVGKSTVSANLAAFFRRRMALETTLIDWDSHGSSSTWLKQAPPDFGSALAPAPCRQQQRCGGVRPDLE